PLGFSNVLTYNEFGQVLTSIDARGSVTTSRYFTDTSNLKNVTTTLSASQFAYDTAGRLLASTDPIGVVTTNTYDSLGNIIQIATATYHQSGADPTIQQTILAQSSYTY